MDLEARLSLLHLSFILIQFTVLFSNCGEPYQCGFTCGLWSTLSRSQPRHTTQIWKFHRKKIVPQQETRIIRSTWCATPFEMLIHRFKQSINSLCRCANRDYNELRQNCGENNVARNQILVTVMVETTMKKVGKKKGWKIFFHLVLEFYLLEWVFAISNISKW